MRSDIEKKISEYATKLETLTGPEDKRVKKRVLAALGKLKKELAGLITYAANGEIINEDQATICRDGTIAGACLSSAKVPETQLSRKQLKAKLKLLNKELADYAQKKQLKTAIKRFTWGVKKGMEPDKHTYANLLNCHVRCGDLEGALTLFLRMKEAKLLPNIVIYTTLLKGYCDKGDLSGAQNLLFSEIPQSKLSPGIRTVNTFMRGCTKIGAVSSALRAYHLIKDVTKFAPDSANDACNESTNKTNQKKRKRPDFYVDDDDNNLIDGSSLEVSDFVEDDGLATDENGGNASLFESVVALLCQALQVDKAALLAMEAVNSAESSRGDFIHFFVVKKIPEYSCLYFFITSILIQFQGSTKTNNTTDFASIYVNLAKACLVLGKHLESDKWLGCAIAALEGSKSSQLRNSMQQNRDNHNQGIDGNADKGGKRTRSIELFLRHRRAEIETEVESINDSLSVIRSSQQTNRSGGAQEVASRTGMLNALSRVLHFGFNGKGDFDECVPAKTGEAKDNTKKKGKIDIVVEIGLTTHLIFALRDKFGLDRIQQIDRIVGFSTAGNVLIDANRALLKAVKGDVVKKVLRSVASDTGFIDYSVLFSTGNKSHEMGIQGSDVEDEEGKRPATKPLPVNIEICSGSGEWVVAHAASDLYYPPPRSERRGSEVQETNPIPQPRALWLALELRCDRVYHTICRSVVENIVRHSQHVRQARAGVAVDAPSDAPGFSSLAFSGLSNLAIIGGDASHILPTHIAPGSIAAVYINHPEPPERTGGVGDSEGKHLLTQDFFTEIHRILSKEGTCTIVTDNLPYAKSLLQALGKAAAADAKYPRPSTSFVSVAFNTSDSDSKADNRILEEEIKINSKELSKSDPNFKVMSGVKHVQGSEEDGSDDDEADGNDDDDFSYINDEDAIMADGNIRSINSKNKSKQNKFNTSGGAVHGKNGPSAVRSGTPLQAGHTDVPQVLQLWRGDSADVDGSDDVHASSYFDRLWERGQKKRRWFMVLKKFE